MKKFKGVSRRKVIAGGMALGGLALSGRMALAQDAAAGPVERTTIRLGLPVPTVSFLPIYIAIDKTFAEEGLTVEYVTFRGDSEVSQALAGGSIDISCQSADGLINLLKSNQPVIGFYAGFNQADFAWFANPAISKWEDLKGKTVGITTYGSLTDQLTRHALRKHGLNPDTDVSILQAGPSAGRLQAVKAGQLDATILSAPHTMIAAADGLTPLGTQADEVAKEWPKHVYISSKTFIAENPNTIRAFLRAHVKAIRLARADRSYAEGIIAQELKYEPEVAARAYDEAIGGYNERGEFPHDDMTTFWEIVMQAGTLTEVWTNDHLLDSEFIDSFDSWAPAEG